MMGLDYKVYTHVSGIRKTVHLTGVLFFVAQQPNSGLGRLNIEVSRSRTITQTFTPGTTPLNEWEACRRGRYLRNTQQTPDKTVYV